MNEFIRRLYTSWWKFLYFGSLMGVTILAWPVYGVELETDVSFSLESWLTYDDNVYLTTRRSEEADLTEPYPQKPGESDYFGRVLGDLRLNYSLIENENEILGGLLAYEFMRRDFSTEDTENNYRQRLKGEVSLFPQEFFLKHHKL